MTSELHKNAYHYVCSYKYSSAVVNCQKACKKCDEGRPCQRCIKLGLTATCVDSPRKERRKGVKRGPYRKRQQQQQQENRKLFMERLPAKCSNLKIILAAVIGSASGQQRLTYGYNEQFNIFASPSGAHQFVQQQQQQAGPFPWTGSTTATRFAQQQQQQQQQANWPSYSQPAISSLCHLQPNQFYETTPQQQQRGTAIDLDPYSFLMQNDPVIMFPSQRTSPISAQPAATSSLLYPNSPTDSLVQSSPASSTLAGSSPEPPTTPPLMSSQTSSVFVPPPSYVPSQVATAHHTMQADPNYTAVPFAKHQQHFPIFHQINHHSTATGKVLF